MTDPVVAAVIPAAGLSARMGRAKLLLPIEGEPLIARIVRAFMTGGASPVVVVTPPRDRPECEAMLDAIAPFNAYAVIPDDQPADMRASVEFGLSAIEPTAFLLAPGDSPAINALIVRTLIDLHAQQPDRILIPAHNGKRGHPVLIPADLASQIVALPPQVGINALIEREADRIIEIPTNSPDLLKDLDTPQDYRDWTGQDLPGT